jgi:hypothetical protein
MPGFPPVRALLQENPQRAVRSATVVACSSSYLGCGAPAGKLQIHDWK